MIQKNTILSFHSFDSMAVRYKNISEFKYQNSLHKAVGNSQSPGCFMAVNLLENLDLLLGLQPVAVHQQADDESQVDAEKSGITGDVFVAGLLGSFNERLDLC